MTIVNKNEYGPTPEQVEAMNVACGVLLTAGITPVVLIGKLADGSRVDVANPEICGKCVAGILGKISELYHRAHPVHTGSLNEG